MSPFSDKAAETIASVGEVQLIEHIREWLGDLTPTAPWGIGDDCAVIETGAGSILVTVDAVVYGRHFDDHFTAEEAGAKLVKRNLSDIAAMGGAPGPAVIALILPPNLRLDWIQGFYRGVAKVCGQYGVSVVGGDITEGPENFFSAHMTLNGVAHRAVRRKGGNVGDHLLVTGSLGGSFLGKQKTFIPRMEEGAWLANQVVVKSMIDITDGLAKDLLPLLPPDGRAELDLQALPLSEDCLRMAAYSGKDPYVHALIDGEDYELLFTLQEDIPIERFLKEWSRHFTTPVTCIGKIGSIDPAIPDARICSREGAPLSFRGYEHLG